MLDNVYAVQVWAVNRMINELVHKVNFWKGKRDEFTNKTYPHGIPTDNAIRANRALALSATSEVTRYSEKLKVAQAIFEHIYPHVEDISQVRLDIEVLSYAVHRGGVQRAAVYSIAMGWHRERLEEAVRSSSGAFFMYSVWIDAHRYEIVSGEPLTSNQQRLFAVHGGYHFDFSYAAMYRQIHDEWVGRVQ